MNVFELKLNDFLCELLEVIKNQIDLGNYKKALLLTKIYTNIRGVEK